jgi:hypothetical protein
MKLTMKSGGSGNNSITKLFFKMARTKRLEVKTRKRNYLHTLVDGGVGTSSTMEELTRSTTVDPTKKDK